MPGRPTPPPPRYAISGVCVDRDRFLGLGPALRRRVGMHLDLGEVRGGRWTVRHVWEVDEVRSCWPGWIEVHVVDPSGLRRADVCHLVGVADQLQLAPADVDRFVTDAPLLMAEGRLAVTVSSVQELERSAVPDEAVAATVMTTDLGRAGGPFDPSRLGLVRRVADDLGRAVLQADGCVDQNTIGLLCEAGCERFVLGRSSLSADLEGLEATLDRLDASLPSANSCDRDHECALTPAY